MTCNVYGEALGNFGLSRFTHLFCVPHSEHLGSSKLMSKLKSSTRHHKTLGARSRPLHALSLPLHGGNQCDNNNQITAANKVLSATHHPHRLITVSFAETKASSYCGGGTPLT